MRNRRRRCISLLCMLSLTACGPCSEDPPPLFEEVRIEHSAPAAPAVAMDGSGNGIVTWFENDRALAALYDDESGWGPDELVAVHSSHDEHRLLHEMDVAMDAAGNIGIVTYRSNSAFKVRGGPAILDGVCELILGSAAGWTPARALRTPPDTSSVQYDYGATPQISGSALGAGEGLFVAWRLSRRPSRVLGMQIDPAAALDTADQYLDDFGPLLSDAQDPWVPSDFKLGSTLCRVACGGNRAGAAVWQVHHDSPTKGSKPWIAVRRHDGSAWGEPLLLTDARFAQSPDVAMDGEGNTIAVWDERGAALMAVHYDAALASWAPPVAIAPSDRVASFRLQLVMNERGDAMLVWQSGQRKIMAVRYTRSGGWEPEQEVGSGSNPRVTFGADGNARAIWRSGHAIESARYDAALGAWETPRLFGSGERPDIAGDRTGTIIAAWWDFDAATLRRQVWKPGAPEPPPDLDIVFASDRDGDLEIYRSKLDGSEVTRITNNTFTDIRPRLSPSGTRIAFLSNEHAPGSPSLELYTMADNGAFRTRRTLIGVGEASVDDPAWSPDESRIAFSFERPGFGGILVYDFATDDVTQITGTPGDVDPTFTGDGESLIFVRNGELATIDLTPGSFPVVPFLTGGNTFGREPATSPDGTMIVFSRSGDLFTANADGTNVQPLFVTVGTVENAPRWSADGSRVAYYRYELLVGISSVHMFDRVLQTDSPLDSGGQEQDPDW